MTQFYLQRKVHLADKYNITIVPEPVGPKSVKQPYKLETDFIPKM